MNTKDAKILLWFSNYLKVFRTDDWSLLGEKEYGERGRPFLILKTETTSVSLDDRIDYSQCTTIERTVSNLVKAFRRPTSWSFIIL